ncbi:hypothetical protein FKW77_001589 [Venturia effusa]|uniref:Superoxide dismutase copper/zinc binding domain-containing protein n=1 Tax=Venturia effusa TaxID=50376 RepID=A0A517LGK4_9PEZI|nr:hypothetical protein FKW77_001589 [Venturia effusa]
MRSSAVLLLCAAVANAQVKMCPLPPANASVPAAVPAPKVSNDPCGAMYIAELKTGSATGSVELSPEETGIEIKVKLTLPAVGMPFMWHIHAKPVPADGNCTGTAAHFDPYAISAGCMCDKSKRQFCQLGDESGKWGNITAGGAFAATYKDEFLSLKTGDKAFVGDKSIVIHSFDNKRIACANITEMKM